ncbi:MAG: hypothetical protein K0R49_604 [Burkholderiales bacterium]|jgi:hypothetical protein|nr:hypothetical protein [Burkholderiales bacterium]
MQGIKIPFSDDQTKNISSESGMSNNIDHISIDVQRERDKFHRVINQISHDIRSPLSSLSMIVSVCTGILEEDRVALKHAITRINDIAYNLQHEYLKDDDYKDNHKEILAIDRSDSLLISSALLEILGEKRYQYKLLNVRFEHSFTNNSNFAFINMEPVLFKRVISHILNNAVDSVDPEQGIITVRLSCDDSFVKIAISDNGRGMSKKLISNIMSESILNEPGNAGLIQVRHTLEKNNGVLSIVSEEGDGTIVTLTMPKIETPKWLAEIIPLNGDDLVVILDDEPSIHGAWNSRFRLHTKRVAIKHFDSGREVINFINDLPVEKQKKIFLLADYELQNQDLNGLEVIEQVQYARSILVTSHFASKKLRADVAVIGAKILPKMLTSEVTITVDTRVEPAEGKKEVNLIFADDDKEFVANMIRGFFAGQYVETFFDPEHLLQDILKYKKDTKICLDNHFEKSGIKGIEVAQKLYEKGFTNLYMLSGNSIDSSNSPEYLKVILKNDLDGIKKMRDA